MSDEESPTVEDLTKLRVVDLKKELGRLGLAQGGVKADLVQRIFQHYQEKVAQTEETPDQSEEPTPEQSKEPSLEPSPEQSKEPSLEPTEDSTRDPTPEPAKVPSPEPVKEPSLEPVKEPSPEPMRDLTPEPVREPTPEPPREPTKEPTPEPAREPTPEPAREPTPEPAREPTPEPVKEPTPEPVKEPSPEPMEEETPRPKLSLQFGPPKVHPAVIAPAVPAPTSSAPELHDEEAPRFQREQTPEPQEEEDNEYGGGKQEYGGQDQEYGGQDQNLGKQTDDGNMEKDEQENGDDDSGKENKKGKKQKNKKKKKKKNRPEQWAMEAILAQRQRMEEERKKTETEVEVEYIQDELDLDPSDPMYRTFNKIFQAFKIVEDPLEKIKEKEEEERKHAEEYKKVPKMLEEDDMLEEEEKDGEDKVSKRKLKKLSRLSVAELKQLVSRPDVVEMHDVTARDPRLLVHLKSTRNTVPVPRHWCFKRKYLQGKRGIEKPPFDLPDFIKKTGIMEMREALQEKEDAKGMKSKQREKVRPKLGKIDIDYQKLHDAFFKWQTKPRMTMHGDLYYEGKEFEIRLKEKKPGDLTDDLRTALGMPVGPNAHKVPAPWLIAMQRYGPPPSYPNLKIAGLNAPIPDGCSFGYHAGGWGKPPVDEAGKPLYGDVFGTSDSRNFPTTPAEDIDHTLWGEMESESEEESDSDEEDEEEEEEGVDSGLQTPVVEPGLATPSGTTSVGGAGLETPDMIELRKRRIEADMEGGDTPSLPYTIIPERKNERIGASMMGSTHTYEIGKGRAPVKGKEAAVEMALNPEDLDLMDSETMALKAEAALREQQASLAKEDLSDMVAEHAAKQKNKRKRQETREDKDKAKKYKEFKF